MTDRPQGPGWWQASDLKWYPPEQHPNYVAPPSPPPTHTATQSPSTTKPPSGPSKAGFVVAGLALLLVIAALVTGRVVLGTFLPGLLLVAVIAIISITVAVRSGQSGSRKAMIVSAMVLVVAVAVPASLKVVYPVYHHFFNDGSGSASPGGASASTASAPSASSLPSPKVTVNGQPLNTQGQAVCTGEGKGNVAMAVSIAVEAPDDVYLELSQDASSVRRVSIHNFIERAPAQRTLEYNITNQTGHASATKDGDSYKVTGTVSGGTGDRHPTYPFEIDFSCPTGPLTPKSATAGAGHVRVTLSGEVKADGDGRVSCIPVGQFMNISTGGDGAQLISTDPLQVKSVTLTVGRAMWEYIQGVAGNASATKDGNTYKITGNAAINGSGSTGTEPFEFDVTCP
jgi:Mycobacterium 19 kDa lipoprotein antigen